ncbi:MAG: hypothetical protein NDI69_12595 [Bacteriovoracaceae bacterium]|nr:hypothetical protein [Bacteriovoracaceae bacterium]
MERMRKPLAILNLTGALLPELKEYFISRNILVIDPLISSATADWTHIITKDIHDFNLINDTYDLTEKDRHIISLTKMDDLQNFTINNGNLILDDVWFKGNLGSFIMDKYFQGYGGITLGDNYPSFQELGSFNVTNPFNTGEYLDRLVQKAFETGVEALNLKTYFDHLIMYVAGLKKQGKAGFPFEFTYGSYEDVFALQMHFFSDHLEILDVTTSLSTVISKRAEEYFLNLAVQSADFFDFSYMPEVNKVIITGLWTKDERIKFENRGLMFSALDVGRVFHKYENEGSTSALISQSPIPDFTERLFFSKTASELNNEVSVVKGSKEEEESSTVVAGSPDEKETSTTVKGQSEEIPEPIIVKGSEPEDTDDEVRIIKGEIGLDEVVNIVKSKFEEEKSVIRVSGNKLDIDKVAYKIAASVDETTKESNLKVRSLGNKIPDMIKTGLYDFAKNLNKPIDDLGDDDIDRFQVEHLPEIIKQGILKKNETSAKDPSSAAADPLKEAEAKLKASSEENEKLKSQMKTLASEVKILKESKAKMLEIQMKASKAVQEEASPVKADSDDELRKHFQQKINDQKILNEMELKKLAGLLERESKLIAEVKAEELKSRKLHIENLQKEAFFAQEIEKTQRQLKAKDLMLIKTKESFTKLVERKDNEVTELRHKNEQLSRTLATSPAQAQEKNIQNLEKQKANLFKQLDVYKIKLSSLASKMQSSKGDDHKEEARKLQMQNNQLKNQFEVSRKEAEKWQAKTGQMLSEVNSLKQEKIQLELLIKKLNSEVSNKEPPKTEAPVNDQELRRMQAQNQILENQLKESASRMVALESKLQETMKSQKNLPMGGDDGSKVKITQLENSVKKLTQDLVENRNLLGEAKKETNKLRQEKTALQNQLDKLKKEALKAKSAPAKKTGKAA